MKKNEKEMRDPLFKYIKEYGIENPKEDFHKKVLLSIEKKREVFTYSPVISNFAWKIISIIISGILVSSFLISSENKINIPWPKQLLPDYKTLDWINPISYLPKITISPLIGISIVVFFLLSIFATYLSASERKRMI